MTGVILAAIVLLGLVSGVVMLFRIPLCTVELSSTGPMPPVSVIIPARNEAANLPSLLGSLAVGGSLPVETVVVDDHSTDGTAVVAESFGARVVQSGSLPPGWLGKPWACQQGAEAATGDLLIFLDADTCLSPGGLSALLNTYQRHRCIMSVMPYHVTRRLHEQFSAVFNIVTAASVNAFSIPGMFSGPSGLFGPCLIVKRVDYEAVGGHETVRDKVLEHFFLGLHFMDIGRSLTCFGGRGVLSYRMYPDSMGDVIRGWGKAFAAGARRTETVPMILVSLWLAGAVTVTVSTMLGAWVIGPHFMKVMVVLYAAYAVEFAWMLSRIGRFSWYTPVFFPAPLVFFLAVFTGSVLRGFRHGGTVWKGRVVQG